MSRTCAVMAGRIATAGVILGLGLGLGATPAALAAGTDTARVPCSGAALASAVSDATGGQTLALAPYCVYGLPAALPAVTGRLSLLGNHATLRPSSAAGPRHFAILTVGTESTAGILTISNLSVSDGDPGIALDDGSVTVSGGTFTGNSPAITSYYFGTRLSVSGAAFTGNTGTFGGAIETGYAARVSDSTFTGNRARVGGGIAAENGRLAVSRCRFVDNRATASGGALSDGGTATVTGSSFAGNTAGIYGGAINNYNPDFASLTVADSRFTGNGAPAGGALYNYNGVTLTGSSFTGNRADQGGAIDNDGFAGGSGDEFTANLARQVGGVVYTTEGIFLSDSALLRNRAGLYGGAVYAALPFFTSTAPLSFTGTTIAGNVAGTAGGGIYDAAPNRDPVTLTDTVVAGNRPDNCAPAGSVAACAGPAGPPAGPARGYTPRSAIRRPEAMAAVKAWKSRSF
jgi:hypothetical protein